ncbi:MAG: transposase [Candidatus Moraniibacteriota bacterium]|jgi:hypothetical protein
MEIQQKVLSLMFPKGIFEWFDLVDGVLGDDDIRITLEEKDIPPFEDGNTHRKILARKFHDITITDFPIRGRRTLITLRRRYWKVEGRKEYLKRDIPVSFPGTQLEKEFADFLKEDGGRGTILAGFYRKVSKDPDQRI